jgi:hypothetical protein
MRRHAEVIIAGRLARYAAMGGAPPVRATRAVVVMLVATQARLAAVMQLFLHVATQERLAAAMVAAVRDHFVVRINRDVVWRARSVVRELVCAFSATSVPLGPEGRLTDARLSRGLRMFHRLWLLPRKDNCITLDYKFS